MARQLRIKFPGGLYHISGRQKKKVFEGGRIEEYFRKDSLRSKTPDANLSCGMRQLSGVYAIETKSRDIEQTAAFLTLLLIWPAVIGTIPLPLLTHGERGQG